VFSVSSIKVSAGVAGDAGNAIASPQGLRQKNFQVGQRKNKTEKQHHQASLYFISITYKNPGGQGPLLPASMHPLAIFLREVIKFGQM